MKKIDQLLDSRKIDLQWQKPQRFNFSKVVDIEKLTKLLNDNRSITVVDHVDLAVNELFDIHNPSQKDTKTDEQLSSFRDEILGEESGNYGNWFYFPWKQQVVHFPPEDDFYTLKTARNRNLITESEQKMLRQSTILIAGLSVGSNVVDALLAQGTGKKYLLFDLDILEPTNMNRIRQGFDQIGEHKVDVIAKKISEFDPYIEQVHYKNGASEQSLEEALSGHSPNVIVDEMDNVKIKIILRLLAKNYRIPVVMAADCGDNILVDIDRYDKKQIEILNGKVPTDVIEKILNSDSLSRAELGGFIGRYFVGLKNTPPRMFESLMEVGKTLPSWPQLGGAAALAGIIMNYCITKIITDMPLKDGDILFGPDQAFDPEFGTLRYKHKTLKSALKIKKALSS